MTTKGNVVKVAFKWYHYAGGFGALLTIIGLIWGFYAHFDMKAHDREMAKKAIEAQEAGKSDMEIKVNLPDVDVDGTVEAIGNASAAAKVKAGQALNAAGETASDLKARAGQKWGVLKDKYWDKKDETQPETEVTK